MTAQSAQINALDLMTLVLYALGIIAFGIISLRYKALNENNGLRAHFLGQGSANGFMVGLALFASTLSATTLVGVSGTAYAHGISVYNYEWPAAVILVIFCAIVLPQILRSGVFTMPEFLEARYGRFARTYVSSLSIFLNIFIDAAGALFAGAILFKIVLPGLEFWQVCLLLSGLAGLFLILGGLRIVMLTETVQGLVMIMICGVMAYAAITRLGGWDQALMQLPPEKLSLIRPIGDTAMPWTGLVTGIPLIAFYFWCTNQSMVQRVLAAKSIDHGRWGSLFAGALKLSNIALIVLPGALAFVLLPGLERPDQVFSAMVFSLLPHGLIGLMLGACIISLVSGIGSVFNAASTQLSFDFIKRLRPDLTDEALIRISRYIIVGLVIISALWAPQVLHIKDTLWQYIQSILSYFVPPVATLFIIGLFWARANDFGARICLWLGTLSGIGFFLMIEIFKLWSLHFLEAAGLIFLISGLGLILGSLFTPHSLKETSAAKDIGSLVFSPSLWHQETEALKDVPFYKNYRVLSVILMLVTALIVWHFA